MCARRFVSKSANKPAKLPRAASPLSTPPPHSWFAAAAEAAKTTGLDTGRSARPACGRPATADPSGNGLPSLYFLIWNGVLAPFQNLERNIGPHFNIFTGTLPSKSGKYFDHFIIWDGTLLHLMNGLCPGVLVIFARN